MAKSNEVTSDASTIRNILTLRYDPTQNTSLPILSSHDYDPIETVSVEYIEKSMQEYVQNKIDKSKIKKIAVALSGGIDSTLILALLRKKFPDIDVETISIKFAQSLDESEKAAKTSEFFGVKHQTIQLENYLKELPQAIFAVGLPFWDLHWYYVVKKAHTITKHLASGDGGDELFGGYTFRYSKFLSLISESATPFDKVKAYMACHERDNVPDQQDVFGPKAEFSWDKIYRFLLPYFDNKLSPLNQVFLADYNGKLLYNFSIVNKKICNHFEINNISPILSQKLIQYSTRLASDQKYDKNNDLGKIPLRQLIKKLGADQFISKEKYGFSVNTINLWKSFGKTTCEYYLSDSRAVKTGLLNHNWIKKYLTQNDLDARYVNKFLGLLAVEIWYRLFVTKEMKPSDSL